MSQNAAREEIKYWRSPDERVRTDDYVESLHDEFAEGASEVTGFQRRDMLKLMGASVALAGVVACRRPVEKILPYTKQPNEVIPGVPNFFATAMPSPNGAIGIVVESHEGRPTKIEGNPDHPSSKGRADLQTQAAVLQLYDPDRSRIPTTKAKMGRAPADWSDWDAFAANHFGAYASSGGTGLAFLSGVNDSPTFLRLQNEVKKRFANAQWFNHDPLYCENTERGAQLAFGDAARVRYNFENAKVILSLQADPLMTGPEHLRHAWGFGQNRKVKSAAEAKNMNRLYAVEAAFSVTGANADHRLRVSMADSGEFLKAVARELLPAQADKFKPAKPFDTRFVRALAKDLAANSGKALIVVGDQLDPSIHALAHSLNAALGGQNKTFAVYQAPKAQEKTSAAQIADLNSQLKAGKIKTLVLIDTNPAYAAAGALQMAENLQKAETLIHVGLYEDESAQMANWHLPMAHFLECWGDARSYDGTAAISQPLIAPLHNGRSAAEILAQLAGQAGKKSYDLVQETWRTNLGPLASDKAWRRAIHDGFIAQTAFASSAASVTQPAEVAPKIAAKVTSLSKDNLEIIFKNSYSVQDGRVANLGWLQELPDPITKIVWDNAILMSPKTAAAFGLESGLNKRKYEADVVEITTNGRSAQLPVFVAPGMNDFSLVVHLGYGRKNAGQVGSNVGVDVYPLVPADGSRFVVGATLKKLNRKVDLATTQSQFAVNGETIKEGAQLTLHNRAPAREGDVRGYEKDPNYPKKKGLPVALMHEEEGKKQPLQLTTPWSYNGNKWGMVIDLTSCIGCNACVTACQSENNIPVVGRESVMRGRLMHWIRVDRYYTGPTEAPEAIHQPVPCMHCENAPCEPVCPVAATAHDHEGLNAMAYNRCIGTRYCANNCPYKVRRFNYFDFSHSGNLYVSSAERERQKIYEMQFNPDVTVRYRGVMEKCTYCTQRIQEAKAVARKEKRDPNDLPDGAVTPACAQTCPTEAITFGNLNDKKSRVAQLKNVDRNYDMLDELNTRPRTSYLSKIKNLNPELV